MQTWTKGGYTYRQTISLAFQMATLTTCLVLLVWLMSSAIHTNGTWLSLGIKTALETALVLSIYIAAVVIWRNSWTPEKGFTDEAAFMPIVGHVNAAFFSDFGWLNYLVVVVPIVSILSGALTSTFDMMLHPAKVTSGSPHEPAV